MPEDAKASTTEKSEPTTVLKPEEPVETKHNFGGIPTRVVASRLPLTNDKGEVDALVFSIAYFKDQEAKPQERPIMFVFNGGPGSPTIWLHMGAVGPMRAPLLPDGNLSAPPHTLEENAHHWLDLADLVFVDPVGTGYSRAKDDATGEKYWGLQGDLDSMAEFIRLFLVRHSRTTSPLYLCGESYGTTRCAGLSEILVRKGTPPKGIILVSSVLNFQTLEFRKGNDLAYPLFLPTYTATAHYHGLLKGRKEVLLKQAKEFALGDYWLALAQGSSLKGKKRAEIKKKLSALTGLSETWLDNCDLRINIHDFCKELLRSRHEVVGRLDSRIKGLEDTQRNSDQRCETDPSMDILMPPYVSLFLDYVRRDLKWETDLEYTIFNGIKKPWNWGSAREGYPDTSDALRKALSRHPYTKVFIASGYFDLATPFFATEYTLSHMGLSPKLAGNIEVKEYEAGHMMYINVECLAELKKDVLAWMSK